MIDGPTQRNPTQQRATMAASAAVAVQCSAQCTKQLIPKVHRLAHQRSSRQHLSVRVQQVRALERAAVAAVRVQVQAQQQQQLFAIVSTSTE